MDLSGSYFEYNGTTSRKYGLIFAHVDTEEFDKLNGEIESGVIFNKKGKRNYFIGESFEDSPLKFEAEIVTDNDEVINRFMRREIEKWLFHQRDYCKLYTDMDCDTYGEAYELVNGVQKRLYLNCRFVNPEKIESGSGLIGYRFTIECDSCMAWQDAVTYEYSFVNVVSSGSLISINDSIKAPLNSIKVFGKTTQNGTPTPDAPVPLENVGDDGSVVVTLCGKNLFPFPYSNSTVTTSGIAFTVNADGSVTANGKSTAATTFAIVSSSQTTVILPKGEYFLSGCPSGGSSATYSIVLRNMDRTIQAIDTGRGARFVLPEAMQIHCTIYFAKSDIAAENLVFKPILNVGSSAMPFEQKPLQHLTVSTPNSLPGIPVTSGGNYTDGNGQQWVCDEVDFEKGQYIQRIYSYTFTGQETINSFDSGKTLGRDIKLLGLPSCIVPNKASGSNVSPMLCTHEAVTTQNALKNGSGGIAVAVWGNTQYLYFSGTYYGDANGLKTAMAEAYASGTPYVWMYALETPIIRELTEAEKVDYTALHTNYPNTTVFNDGGAGMEVKYCTSTTITVNVDTDLGDYVYPKVTIQTGTSGGDIQIINFTDDNTRATSFVSLSPNITLTMRGDGINYISGDYYQRFSNKNFIRLLDGENEINITGDVTKITFEFQNRRYL